MQLPLYGISQKWSFPTVPEGSIVTSLLLFIALPRLYGGSQKIRRAEPSRTVSGLIEIITKLMRRIGTVSNFYVSI